MEYLGNTIAAIATEKAGIIKPETPVVYWGEDSVVTEVIEQIAKEQNSKTINVSKKDYKIIKNTRKGVDFYPLCGYYLRSNFSISFMADYQVENAMLAIRACEALDIQKYLDTVKLTQALSETRWEGRMEEIAKGVILDGAHNEPGIEAFVKAFQEYKCDGNKRILFSVVKDKDYDAMVCRLCQTDADCVYITKLESSRGLDEEAIVEDFKKHNFQGRCLVFPNVETAYRQACLDKQEEDVLFCAGSLYLIGELKALTI
jgi:dihydrofolate synthase/folylpolyglutamate synthase